MGFTPQQVNEMSFWEYSCAVDGYRKANGASEGGEKIYPTDEQFQQFLRTVN